MQKVLITGGTVFVSRYAAEFYVKKGYHVFVLNRNSKVQPEGVTLIEADRHDLGIKLLHDHFDIIFDISAYTANDVNLLLNAVGSYDDYILISSGAVYPENCPLPFMNMPHREQTNSGATMELTRWKQNNYCSNETPTLIFFARRTCTDR